MPDLYASIANVDQVIQSKLADILELRASDPRQRNMLNEYLSEVTFPQGAKVLEAGCGTGAVSRILANTPNVASVTGIDPSTIFIERAKQNSHAISGLSFQLGDARSMDFDNDSFDLVIFHTTLTHIPGPTQAILEARRVLRPDGLLVIFDGDYATATVALEPDDPLQIAVNMMMNNFVENMWLVRRLPTMLRENGLALNSYRSHAYTTVEEPEYFFTIIDRGVDLLISTNTMDLKQAEFIRLEARRRADAGEFFGHISFISAVANKH